MRVWRRVQFSRNRSRLIVKGSHKLTVANLDTHGWIGRFPWWYYESMWSCAPLWNIEWPRKKNNAEFKMSCIFKQVSDIRTDDVCMLMYSASYPASIGMGWLLCSVPMPLLPSKRNEKQSPQATGRVGWTPKVLLRLRGVTTRWTHARLLNWLFSTLDWWLPLPYLTPSAAMLIISNSFQIINGEREYHSQLPIVVYIFIIIALPSLKIEIVLKE